MVKCADKYTVRKYIKEKGLGEILTKVYGCYNSSNEINFQKFPSKYVIKTSNACKTIIIVKDSNNINKEAIKNQLKTWQDMDYSKVSVEPHYGYMFPKIIVEEFLEDGTGLFPIDYKFFCFNGEPKFVEVVTDRDEKHQIQRHFYDLNWNPLELTKVKDNQILKKPSLLNRMIDVSKVLSKDFPFVRIDLYVIKDKITFGEMTFTPSSGMATYFTDDAQKQIGKLLSLPKTKKIGFK